VVVEGLPGVTTRTQRLARFHDGRVRCDNLGESFHGPQAQVVEVGPPLR